MLASRLRARFVTRRGSEEISWADNPPPLFKLVYGEHTSHRHIAAMIFEGNVRVLHAIDEALAPDDRTEW